MILFPSNQQSERKCPKRDLICHLPSVMRRNQYNATMVRVCHIQRPISHQMHNDSAPKSPKCQKSGS